MITVVCMSPSLDRTLVLEALAVGGTNRVQDMRTVAGGKGVNVAMTLKALGCPVRLVTYRHAQGAQPLFDALKNADIDAAAVDVPGALRVNLKLLDKASDTITEINASAEAVPQEAQQQMEDAIIASAKESDWLVLTGSMPAGCDAGLYARLIERTRKEAPACRTALDAEGEALRLGALAKPDLVKPNRHELELLTGRTLDGDKAVTAAAQALVGSGVGAALVSMDREGSMLVCGEAVFRARAVEVPVVTTVGAGDAMLSGYLSDWCAGSEKALRTAVAAATARVAGVDGQINRYLPLVQLK